MVFGSLSPHRQVHSRPFDHFLRQGDQAHLRFPAFMFFFGVLRVAVDPLETGVGVIVATQNPMDLDYRALSNAGLWCLGRLQTDADRERVLDGLGHESVDNDLDQTLQRLAPRWLLVRNARGRSAPILLHPRQTMTLLRGPMTRTDLRRAIAWRAGEDAATIAG